MSRFFFALICVFGCVATFSAEPEKGTLAAITDPEQALEGIPRDVLQDLRPGSRKIQDAAAKATLQVRKNVENKMGTLKFTVREVEKYQRNDAPTVTRYRVRGVTEKMRAGGGSFSVYPLAIPDPSEEEKIAKLKPGDKVTFTGKISNGEILGRDTAELHIDLLDAKLK